MKKSSQYDIKKLCGKTMQQLIQLTLFKISNYNSSSKKELKDIKNKGRHNQYYNFYYKKPIKTSVLFNIVFIHNKRPKMQGINKYYLLQSMWMKVLLLFF